MLLHQISTSFFAARSTHKTCVSVCVFPSLSSAPMPMRTLQDLCRIYIRRALRELAGGGEDDGRARRARAQRVPQKRKRRHRRRHRISTYAGDEEHKDGEANAEEEEEEEDKEERDLGDVEILKQVNIFRDQIMALPLPGSLKEYLLHYRKK